MPEALTRDVVPVSGSEVASLPRKERFSAKRVANFFWSQFQSAVHRRKTHAIAWMQIHAYYKGIHYFSIDGDGRLRPIPPKKDDDRGIVPYLVPTIRHFLGFFNANRLGVSAIPTASTPDSIYAARRAEDSLNSWIHEIGFAEVFDQANQILLIEGTVGYALYADTFRKNVIPRAIPGSEIFPIPFDARNPEEASGLNHARLVTKQWLEAQDEIFLRQTGQRPERPMADKAKTLNFGLRSDLPSIGSVSTGGSFEGALTSTVYMKPTEQHPMGEYAFLIGNELFRHIVPEAEDDETLATIMPGGRLPIEIAYFDKNPDDFWGVGMGELLIATQKTLDSQMTNIKRNLLQNRALTFVDTEMVDMSQIQGGPDSLIGFQPRSNIDPSRRRPIWPVPSQPVSRDLFAILEVARSFGDLAAGGRSGILFGNQEGRTESGPATSLLSQNAMASLQPAIQRIFLVHQRLYEKALDMFPKVWDSDKFLRVLGPNNVGREIKAQADKLPPSNKVILIPSPILAGGRQAQTSTLFQLQQLPGPDGKPGTLLKPQEFLRSLQKLQLLPPGIEMENRAEARIQTRINLLINDTQKPGIEPSDPLNRGDRLLLEDHKLAISMIRDTILDDTFLSYSQEVQQGLLKQFAFHQQQTFGGLVPSGEFDDDIERIESLQLEDFLATAEAQGEGQVSFDQGIFP